MNRQLLHNVGSVTKVVFARLRFLSVFLIAGLIIGYWDNITNHWDKWTRPAVAPDALAGAQAGDVEYYCVMHPNIIRSEAGNCPICGMPLVKRRKGEAAALPQDVLARVQLSPQRITLAGIQTSPVERRLLIRQIRALGVLDYNETRIARLSAWVAGRADELFVQYVGQAVEKDDPVYSLYSPDVFTALKEYLLSRERVNELPKDASPETRADAVAIYNASLQKLVLWGISQKQLDQIDHEYDQTQRIPTHLIVTSPIRGIVVSKDIFEGGYVNAGDKPYTIADLNTLWLQLKLYERDVPLVKVGQPVDVVVEALPNQVFHGSVTFKAFQLDPQTRTLDARVEVKNLDLRLRPGMFAEASIEVPLTDRGEASEPATQPSAAEASAAQASPQAAQAFAAALDPYLKVQALLAHDQADGVPDLLQQVAHKLQPLAANPALVQAVQKVADAAHASMGKDIETIRKSTFRDASNAMIAIGKETGLPTEAKPVSVFRCPMAKSDWLQPTGATQNPFYGSAMLECGGAVEPLPKAETVAATAATRPATQRGTMSLAIARSSVIEAGRNRIVYVESAPGVFDMRAVQLGPLAGDFYPVLSGLSQGDKVVTVGAFLIDSENRLNPMPAASDAGAEPAAAPAAAGQHQH
jgi:multidrug efflux pump subunit AcrA (membrane-fusion protein)